MPPASQVANDKRQTGIHHLNLYSCIDQNGCNTTSTFRLFDQEQRMPSGQRLKQKSIKLKLEADLMDLQVNRIGQITNRFMDDLSLFAASIA